MNKDLNKKFIYGLEIHVQLNTKRKLFSSSLNDAYSIENQNVSLFDLGVAGVFPRLNAESIILAMKACAIFNSTIATNITFDRKHYRYLDLPHSYQTTQFDNPIGRGGEYYINKVKSITLDNIHLETDAAKLKEYDDKIVIDYNRCSVSLIEIVTNPDFRQIEEIELFINLLVQDLQINNISEAKFEMSQIRVDVNLSMIDDNEKSITPRLELKNLNSIRNIRKAVLLAQQLLQTKLEHDYTVHYNDISNTIKLARKKEKYNEYMYFHDSAIPATSTKIFGNYSSIKSNTIYTIQTIEHICNLCSNKLNSGEINLMISNINIRTCVKAYIDAYPDIDYVKPIQYIMELKTVLIDIEYKHFYVITFLIHQVYTGKILKFNILIIIEHIIQSNMYDLNDIKQYIQDKNMYTSDISCNRDDIIEILNSVDASIINRLKNKKVFNYALGIVLKKYIGIKPNVIIDILNSLNMY